MKDKSFKQRFALLLKILYRQFGFAKLEQEQKGMVITMNKTLCNAEEYKRLIFEIVNNTDNTDILKRIYNLASYLYIHNRKSRRNDK